MSKRKERSLRTVVAFRPMSSERRNGLLIVDDRAGVRGVMREFIEATTHYKVCDAVDEDVSAIQKATKSRCDLILLHLTMPLQDSLVTVPVLRRKLPQVKIVGFSTWSADLGNLVSPAIGLDAILTNKDGLSELVATLIALMPEPPQA